MKLNIDRIIGSSPASLQGVAQNLFGSSPSKKQESKEEKIIKTKLKYGLFHGNGIRKKKPRKKRKKTYGKRK